MSYKGCYLLFIDLGVYLGLCIALVYKVKILNIPSISSKSTLISYFTNNLQG